MGQTVLLFVLACLRCGVRLCVGLALGLALGLLVAPLLARAALASVPTAGGAGPALGWCCETIPPTALAELDGLLATLEGQRPDRLRRDLLVDSLAQLRQGFREIDTLLDGAVAR